MTLKINTYYKTRGGQLAFISGTNPNSKIWSFVGEIIGSTKDERSWTKFGGLSARYNSPIDVDDPKWHIPDDLIEELPKEDYPEYYL